VSLENSFNTRHVNVTDKIKDLKNTGNKSLEEQRQLEQDYLKPEHLRPYLGVNPSIDPIAKLTVKLVFPSEERLEQFKRHFRVAKYVEPSVTNIGVLCALLDELDTGRIAYDKNGKCIAYEGSLMPAKSKEPTAGSIEIRIGETLYKAEIIATPVEPIEETAVVLIHRTKPPKPTKSRRTKW